MIGPNEKPLTPPTAVESIEKLAKDDEQRREAEASEYHLVSNETEKIHYLLKKKKKQSMLEIYNVLVVRYAASLENTFSCSPPLNIRVSVILIF